MQQLVQGIHYFQNVGFRERAELFQKLRDSQKPEALLITCSDSRIVPSLITNSEPGQLFIVRNVGNLVPCHGVSLNGELAAVEYAIKVLGIEDLIVCGHTGCGAMTALVTTSEVEKATSKTPSVFRWLRHAEATLEIIREHYSHLEGEALVNAAAEENVLVQLEHLRTLPVVASRLAAGRIRLHGWIYKIETGEIFDYIDELGQYTKFEEFSGNRVADAKAQGLAKARLS